MLENPLAYVEATLRRPAHAALRAGWPGYGGKRLHVASATPVFCGALSMRESLNRVEPE